LPQSTLVPIENEPAPSLIVEPPLPGPLAQGGVFDNMIPVRNSYFLAEHLPKAMLLTYPDAGHGSLLQYHESFVTQASLFLDGEVL
jgi:pimeloyl-ACP methyl ester carboxylesterase